MLVGQNMLIGRGMPVAYQGPIVASADAFYLVLRSTQAATGLAGELASLISNAIYKPFSESFVDLSQLPPDIAEHQDWPVKERSGPVRVVSKLAVRRVTYSFWTTFALTTDENRYGLEFYYLRRSKVLRYLKSVGWSF
jgi:hypothetical protein